MFNLASVVGMNLSEHLCFLLFHLLSAFSSSNSHVKKVGQLLICKFIEHKIIISRYVKHKQECKIDQFITRKAFSPSDVISDTLWFLGKLFT